MKIRKPARTTYIVSAGAPDSDLDTALSGPLLRLLCHHAHMLANLSVSREGELPQIKSDHLTTDVYDEKFGKMISKVIT